MPAVWLTSWLNRISAWPECFQCMSSLSTSSVVLFKVYVIQLVKIIVFEPQTHPCKIWSSLRCCAWHQLFHPKQGHVCMCQNLLSHNLHEFLHIVWLVRYLSSWNSWCSQKYQPVCFLISRKCACLGTKMTVCLSGEEKHKHLYPTENLSLFMQLSFCNII